MPAADYCRLCEFPFRQMGACPAPEKPVVYAYLSLLPYLIPALCLLLALLRRSLPQLKLFLLLASAYVFGDKLLKPIFMSPRPEFSCKSSFGMPSSHMVVMAAFAFHRIRSSSSTLPEKALWAAATVAQGVARMELNYHTLEQVIAGTLIGILYVLPFDKLWTQCLTYLPSKPKQNQQ